MKKYNNELKIIDATSNIIYDYSIEELWLDPNNLLTIANNIKNGFNSDLIRPIFSILNPEYTFSVPKMEMVSGIFDIFSHLMEQYL